MKKFITEETEVNYNSFDELSYIDDGNDYVSLYVNKEWEGDIKVWKDSEMDGREYVCINYEIVYLDTLKKL
jgi:outer membrane usher protein FimD/PapC